MSVKTISKYKEVVALINDESLRRCSIKVLGWSLCGKYPFYIRGWVDNKGGAHLGVYFSADLTGEEAVEADPAGYFSVLLAACVEGVVDGMSGSDLPSLANALEMFIDVDGKVDASKSGYTNISFPFARAVHGEDAESVLNIARVFDRIFKNTIKRNNGILGRVDVSLLANSDVDEEYLQKVISKYNPLVMGRLTKALSPLFPERG